MPIGRNDQCPCGSGKKYKKCCLGKTEHDEQIGLGQPHGENAGLHAEMNEIIGDAKFNSIEEAVAGMDEARMQYNNIPKTDFLDLTPEQMHRILYSPFENTEDIVTLNESVDSRELKNAPIIKESSKLLTMLSELGPVKATKSGNLPRNFAQEISKEFPREYFIHAGSIQRETDVPRLFVLRHVLAEMGLISLSKGVFHLTPGGREAIASSFAGGHYSEFVKTCCLKFSWAFQDRLPEFPMIQTAAIFSLYMLHKKADDFIHARDLAGCFLKAFPISVHEAYARQTKMGDYEKSRIGDTFTLRFIQRFCLWLGLVEAKSDGPKQMLFNDFLVKTTGTFKTALCWKV
jgi:hypothetical protein